MCVDVGIELGLLLVVKDRFERHAIALAHGGSDNDVHRRVDDGAELAVGDGSGCRVAGVQRDTDVQLMNHDVREDSLERAACDARNAREQGDQPAESLLLTQLCEVGLLLGFLFFFFLFLGFFRLFFLFLGLLLCFLLRR